jgi:hypothetical protein
VVILAKKKRRSKDVSNSSKNPKKSDLFLLALVAIVAIVGVVVMVLQAQSSFTFDEDLVGEAYAMKSNLKADAVKPGGGEITIPADDPTTGTALETGGDYIVDTDGVFELPFLSPYKGSIVVSGAASVEVEELKPGYYTIYNGENGLIVMWLENTDADDFKAILDAGESIAVEKLKADALDPGVYIVEVTEDYVLSILKPGP